MRYLVGFVVAVALTASSLGVSARNTDEGTSSEGAAQGPALTSEPTSEEPALQLRLDEAGVEVEPSQRASIAAAAKRRPLESPGLVEFRPGAVAAAVGAILGAAGAIGMIVTGATLGSRKRQLRQLEQAHDGTPRRAQWDLARSRLVF